MDSAWRRKACAHVEDALPLACVSALMSVDPAAPKAGDVVVVIGASGGIGSYAVQLSAIEGAHVIGVTSTGNTDYVKDLGADEGIDRNAQRSVGRVRP